MLIVFKNLSFLIKSASSVSCFNFWTDWEIGKPSSANCWSIVSSIVSPELWICFIKSSISFASWGLNNTFLVSPKLFTAVWSKDPFSLPLGSIDFLIVSSNQVWPRFFLIVSLTCCPLWEALLTSSANFKAAFISASTANRLGSSTLRVWTFLKFSSRVLLTYFLEATFVS